jgi:hypothetical protein
MAVTYYHFAIIIQRSALIKIINSGDASKRTEAAKLIADTSFGDGYLIVVESMNSNLEDEKYLLTEAGLIWNDGHDCIDYYIPTEGAFTASWLEYARLKEGKVYYSTYKKIGVSSEKIIGYLGSLETKFPTKSRILNRRNWGVVARDDGNPLYYPSYSELMQIVRCNDRVCPKPSFWSELYEIAIEADFNQNTLPQLPLILRGWWESNDEEKAARLIDLLEWSQKNNVSNVVWAYITTLREDEWHHTY